MHTRLPRALALLVLATATPARGEHDHGAHEQPGHSGTGTAGPALELGLGVLAATYESMLYLGSYQGLVASARWSQGRFGVAASLAGYRIERNGMALTGLGDAMVHGQVTLWSRGAVAAGVVVAATLPTGDQLAGLGMGHVMLMPASWASWATARVSVSASLGYGRGLGDPGIHAQHGGVWPLVDPMGFSEVTAGAGVTLGLTHTLHAGARLAGAVPTGQEPTRASGGVRVIWTAGRVESSLEASAGLLGDPFGVRGMATTAIRFD